MFLLCLFVSLKRTHLLIRKARQPAPETNARRPHLFLQGHSPNTSQLKHLSPAEKEKGHPESRAEVRICLSLDGGSRHCSSVQLGRPLCNR